MTLEEKLKTLPGEPGIYIMKNKEGTIIYVGKAKVLKNRVRQYFQASKNHPPKVAAMVANIADFDYIITDSETEAFALEINYIKQYKPYYNILLKDDKHYPYIKITMQEPYPKLSLVRKIERDGARYFGPYTDSGTVRELIAAMRRVFRVQACKKTFPRDIGKERPCIYYAMGRCSAPCRGEDDGAEYLQRFQKICSFLKGDHQKLVNELTGEMYEASADLNFERAAALRNEISAINKLMERQKVISTTLQDFDVVAFARLDEDVSCVVFHVQGGKLKADESFQLTGAETIDDSYLMNDFLNQYYSRDMDPVRKILLACAPSEQELFEDFLAEKFGHKVEVRVPQRGEGLEIVRMAQKNAKKNLETYRLEKLKSYLKKNVLNELQEKLALPTLPKRIEAYDISNISGTENVGGMVVFADGKPAKKEYRRFKIKTVDGADDYASMREMLTRRFVHALAEQKALATEEMDVDEAKFALLPDLILMDGGKAHMQLAKDILDSMALPIPVFGMVKDDRHKTRGVVATEGEIELLQHTSAFRLITQIQDEVHDYAISYHRLLREKKAVASALEQIPGIGPARRKKLLEQFRSVEKIKNASKEALADVIGPAAAEQVYRYFQQQKGWNADG